MKKLSIKEMRKKKKGFTLIELIIVVAIIAILAAIALPKFGNVKKDANISADLATAKNIQSTIAKGIAENKIQIGTAKTGQKVTTELGETDSPFTVASKIDGSTTPALKDSSSSEFSFNISADGDVTVYRGTTTNTLYPKPTGIYAPATSTSSTSSTASTSSGS